MLAVGNVNQAPFGPLWGLILVAVDLTTVDLLDHCSSAHTIGHPMDH